MELGRTRLENLRSAANLDGESCSSIQFTGAGIGQGHRNGFRDGGSHAQQGRAGQQDHVGELHGDYLWYQGKFR